MRWDAISASSKCPNPAPAFEVAILGVSGVLRLFPLVRPRGQGDRCANFDMQPLNSPKLDARQIMELGFAWPAMRNGSRVG